MADKPDNPDPDALLDALESIKHLLDAEQAGGRPAARAPRPTATPAAVPSPPHALPDDEDPLPVLDEIVRPGELTASERAALARALLALQDALNQRIDQTLRQAARQIADKLKQDLQRQIDALLGP